MTNRAPTEREPRTDLLDIAERLRAVAHFESFGDAPNGDFVMFDKDDALALLAAASPSCSSCHHPIHDFGDVGECPCGCIENPATETGGLPSVEDLAKALAYADRADDDSSRWYSGEVGYMDYEDHARATLAGLARLRSPSVGEGSGEGGS